MSAAASRERQHKEGIKLMSTTQGKFVWYDLMTSDSKAAESFYRSVIGWDAKDSGMADRSYTLFSAGPMMVGGMMPIPEEARAMGARPAWNGYVLVDDVDVYAERVKAAGGEDIPGVGRFRSKPMAGRGARPAWRNRDRRRRGSRGDAAETENTA